VAEHRLDELVHARGGRRSGRSHGLVAHGGDRTDVLDEPVLEVHRQALAFRDQVNEALVGGVAAGEDLAGEQQPVARFPGRDLRARDPVEVDASARRDIEGELRPVVEPRRLEPRGTA
jgi:hypothetical protein